jgi:ABC-type multidrug transport system permease subunit
MKLVTTALVALFCVLLFYNLGEDAASVQTRNGALFFICLQTAMGAIQNVILIFPDERAVFLREVNNQMYSVTAYYLAKVLSELPMGIISPVLFGCIEYYGIGLNN